MTRARPLTLGRRASASAATMLPVLAWLAYAAAPASAASESPHRVDNGDAPRDGVERRELVEQWRRGGEDDDLFFGLIVDAVADDDGRIYLLDAQLNEIYALDADGEHAGTLGRRGEGPGEFDRVIGLVDLPDGTLGVVQRFPGRIVKLNRDGTPAGTILTGDPAEGGRDALSGAAATADGLVLCGSRMTFPGGGPRGGGRSGGGRRGPPRGEVKRHNFVGSYSLDGAPGVEYHGKDDAFDLSSTSFAETDNDFVNHGRWAVLPGGGVVLAASRDEYLLTVAGRDGTPLLEMTRPAAPPRRSDEQLERLERSWTSSRRYQRTGAEQVFAETDPMIRDLEVAADGSIWALPAEGLRRSDEGILQAWDVFDPDGVWTRRVEFAGPGDPTDDRVIVLDEEHVLVISDFRAAQDAMNGLAADDEEEEAADAAPMEVILYAIR